MMRSSSLVKMCGEGVGFVGDDDAISEKEGWRSIKRRPTTAGDEGRRRKKENSRGVDGRVTRK